MSFCPVCGKTINRGETFCEEHTPKTIHTKEIIIKVCDCGRIMDKNQWVMTKEIEKKIKKIIQEKTRERINIKELEYEMPEKRGQKREGTAKAEYEGEKQKITFTIINEQCDKCAKIGTQYYTAKLQLRNPPEGVIEEIKKYLEGKEKKGIAINKIEETPRGPDLYLTHKTAAQQLGEKLIRKFGGTKKESEQLFSRDRQTSKELYRLNVVVEFPKFKKNEVIIINDRVVKVTGLGKQCTGRDLARDKKVVFTAGEEEKKLEKKKSRITRTKPRIMALDPEDYQEKELRNKTLPELKINQEVKVVKYKKQLFLA